MKVLNVLLVSKLKVLNVITCAILNISTMCHKNPLDKITSQHFSRQSWETYCMLCFSGFHTITGMAGMISVFVSMVDQLHRSTAVKYLDAEYGQLLHSSVVLLCKCFYQTAIFKIHSLLWMSLDYILYGPRNVRVLLSVQWSYILIMYIFILYKHFVFEVTLYRYYISQLCF